ncbi:Fe-S oxidoreductase [Thermus scotoductus]|uniref:Fe-S oxidoreductase n=1 Tax=Thermus scotoductus TaxID=37636 RepID=A0A430S672_THESC|nr:(Fe-S)-binding protein [Thermus scotoductus]RTG93815.1 Fe-S oxidoreductase [Thermus scotoductus]RTH07163.1 Fe-S oxidoreductase [Thermus scotoductus]RTH10118.1 Fe-S oxidoreductase [Thermus scotoductus]RTH12116.1 Fe-S oxidoreductase [Thermus scotoductus]RTH15777.1 Fe-S oxidoreductase [Thermus scotoductus]
MRVALFITCLADQFYAEAGVATVRLLRALGVEVDFPKEQTCCGQPAFNAGHWKEARSLAQRTVGIFQDAQYVVLPSGSCASMVKNHYLELLPGDGEALRLSEKTYELSQFLVRVLGVTELGKGLQGKTIAYHHGCHALRELGVKEEPLLLLKNSGAEILPWEAAEECCGFGGLFSVKLPEVSLAMADRKISTLPKADALTSTDAGCLLHLTGRMGTQGRNMRVVPLATLLWKAYAG